MHRGFAALACLPLVGATLPQADAGAAVECRLPYADTGKAAAGLNITRSSGEDPNAEGGVVKFYNPGGISVLGAPVSAYSESEFVADGVHRKIFRADVPLPFATARTAMLRFHKKASCDAHESTTAGERDCMIHIREEDGTPGRDVDMVIFEMDGADAVTVGCIYTQQ